MVSSQKKSKQPFGPFGVDESRDIPTVAGVNPPDPPLPHSRRRRDPPPDVPPQPRVPDARRSRVQRRRPSVGDGGRRSTTRHVFRGNFNGFSGI